MSIRDLEQASSFSESCKDQREAPELSSSIMPRADTRKANSDPTERIERLAAMLEQKRGKITPKLESRDDNQS